MNEINVKGLADLQAALDSLPAKIEANIMRAAVRAGAKVIAKAAQAAVPDRRGVLRDSVRFGAKVDRVGGKIVGYVRAGGRGKKSKKTAFYARMVEFGTAAHLIAARPGKHLAIGGGYYQVVHHPGARKKPFMRPAMDAQSQAAMQAMAEYIRQRLSTKYGIEVPAPVDADAEE